MARGLARRHTTVQSLLCSRTTSSGGAGTPPTHTGRSHPQAPGRSGGKCRNPVGALRATERGSGWPAALGSHKNKLLVVLHN